MSRTLTITIPDDLYAGLQERVSPDEIDRFFEELLRPHLLRQSGLEAAYRAMAADEERERKALEWIESAPDEALVTIAEQQRKAMADQIRTIAKERLTDYVDRLSQTDMAAVERAIRVQLDL